MKLPRRECSTKPKNKVFFSSKFELWNSFFKLYLLISISALLSPIFQFQVVKNLLKKSKIIKLMMLKRNPPGRSLVRYRIFYSKKKSSQFVHYLFWVQKDLFFEHFFLTIQKQKYGTIADVKRCTRYVFKMVFKNFSSKSFNKTIHQMEKNALYKFFRMIFMRCQKLTSNNFDDFTWQKNGTIKKLSAADLKRKICDCSIVQQLFVFYQQNNKLPK